MNETLPDKAKSGSWIFRKAEDRLRPFLAKYVPSWIETHHLTLATLVWTGGIIVFGYLAQYSIHWLWLTSLMIICQYTTDLLDGTIGRLRNTGLVQWGYFMDHMLDFVFFTALILSYIYIFPSTQALQIVAVALLQIGFMMNIFLAYGASKDFSISFVGIGPTEIRLLYIVFNIYILFLGTAIPIQLMPFFIILMTVALVLTVYFTQKALWLK